MENCLENAKILKEGIEKTGRFDIVSKDMGVPLVAFSLKDSGNHNVFEISESLRRFGWIVPAYTMPPDAEHIAVLRVVIREDFSRSLAERLVSDIVKVLRETDALPPRSTKAAHGRAEVGHKEDGEGDGVVTKKKKTERETQEEVTTYWRRFVERKKTSGVC